MRLMRPLLGLLLVGCPAEGDDTAAVDTGLIDAAIDGGSARDAADAGDEDSGTPDAGTPRDTGPPPPIDCGDDDPLTNADWAGFCDDRLDDNCRLDDLRDPCPLSASVHNHCQTGDELCPETQPAAAAFDWDCQGALPPGVIGAARFAGNAQVASFCLFIFENPQISEEFWVGMRIENGPDFLGPGGACAEDLRFRRYYFLSNLDEGPCPPVTVDFPTVADAFVISNGCRKALRATTDDLAFDPDLHFFATSRAEADAKLDVLETAEIACIAAVDRNGDPYRPWVVQASAAIERP